MKKLCISLSLICGLQYLQAQQRPVIYQMLVRTFGNKNTTNKFYGSIQENGVGKFNDITDRALDSLKSLHISHIWYTGIIRHATTTEYSDNQLYADDPDIVKGRAGSPYAIKDYYDIDPDLAENVQNRKAEFASLIARTHQHGMKVLMDFIPNHVSRSYKENISTNSLGSIGGKEDTSKSFSAKNDFYYLPGTTLQLPENKNVPKDIAALLGMDGKYAETPAKATGNDVFSNEPSIDDWYETIKLNYGVDYAQNKKEYFTPNPPLWLKLEKILKYWASQGIDGFRCDMIEMVPVAFWHWVIPKVKKDYPETIFIGEAYNPKVYTAYLNEGHFDYLYDKTGMYDLLRNLITNTSEQNTASIDSIERARNSQQFVRFLENHDEQRIASSDFARDPISALPAMAVISTLPNSPIMIYNGQEVGENGAGKEGFNGEDGRTTIFDYWGVPAQQQWMNHGNFDGGLLSEKQKDLRKHYQFLLSLVNGNPIIQKGKYQVVSDTNTNKKQFAFFRYTNDKIVFIIANFDKINAFNKTIRLPEIHHLKGYSKNPAKWKNLQSSEAFQKINWENGIHVNVLPNQYSIIAIE